MCYRPRRRASRHDICFWVKRRGLQKGISKDRRRFCGEGLEEGTLEGPVSSTLEHTCNRGHLDGVGSIAFLGTGR